MSDDSKTPQNTPSAQAPLLILALSSMGAAVFAFWVFKALKNLHQATFEWLDVVFPGVLCLLFLAIFVWAVSQTRKS